MSARIGERLEEIVDFDFANGKLSQKAREELSVKLCSQFLVTLSDSIEKNGVEKVDDVQEEETIDDKLGVMQIMENYLKGPMAKTIASRNLKCNGVLPFISALPVPDWQKRDVPLIISFGFPTKIPLRLLFRKRSNRLFELLVKELDKMFPGMEVTDVDHNSASKVPFLTFYVNNVSVIVRISIKPFCGPQYLASDVIEKYRKIDDRFIVLANFFHNYLKLKIRKKSDERKSKSVIPKLCSIKMMFVHFFKHYGLLPTELESLEARMSNLKLSSESKSVCLGTLFLLFLDYFLDVISLETDFLEISTGESIEKKSIGLTNLNILSISDIFDDHLPGERVNDTLILKRIMKASYNAILKHVNNRTGDLINDLNVIPLRPRHVEL